MDCLFCKIINRTIPSDIIYEDDQILAFSDIGPQAPQHKLLIPKKHIATLNDLTAEDAALMGHLISSAKIIAKQVGVAETGYRLVANCGSDANQTVQHIHFHLIGGRPMSWPPG